MSALGILRKYQDDNEYHFHEVDEEWIVEAMEEYASIFPGFWERLEFFVLNVSVNDPMSKEEKEMILNTCRIMQAKMP